MSEALITISIALITSSGMWTLLTHLLDGRAEKNKEQFDEMHEKIDSINDKIDSLATTVSATMDVSLSTTRDRLNYQSNKFLSQGYIPLEDYDAFIDMGDAYIGAGGNSVVKGKFEKCKELEVK